MNWVNSPDGKLVSYIAQAIFGTIVGVGGQLVVERMSWWEWVLFFAAIGLNVSGVIKAFSSGRSPDELNGQNK